MICTKPGRYINGLLIPSIGMLKGIKHCHFERACPLSLPAEHGFCHFERSLFCHFERSPKGEVEKSARRPRPCDRPIPAKPFLSFRAKPEGRSREICFLSLLCSPSSCHFERSPKAESRNLTTVRVKQTNKHRPVLTVRSLRALRLVEMTRGRAWPPVISSEARRAQSRNLHT